MRPGVQQTQRLRRRRAAPLLAVQGRRPRPRRRHHLVPAVGADVAGVGGRRSTASTRPRSTAGRSAPIDLDRTGQGATGRHAAARCTAASLLTTGAARTLHDAIPTGSKAEDARDVGRRRRGRRGDRDGAARRWPTPSSSVDIVTAALDGFRNQLLGLPGIDGLRRPAGGTATPAPGADRPPRAAWPGRCASTAPACSTPSAARSNCRSARSPSRRVARSTATPARSACRRGSLRPSRWQFRLVDAATPAGAEGVEARVDQVEPALQVSPVAGFVLPDHLDESLEVFAADGAPARRAAARAGRAAA